MSAQEILLELQSLQNPENTAGMARYGINTTNALSIPVPWLRQKAKSIGKNHPLALELWETGVHEARLLAAFIADPNQLTEEQMERWVVQFDSWDVCDQVCSNLFDRSPLAVTKAVAWSRDQIATLDSRTAHWIAADALRELNAARVRGKLKS